MINFKNDIKEQVNSALRELNSSIDMLYTANNLLTINRILEQMRLQISNLIYLNEIRDKYTIRKPADTEEKPEAQHSENETLKETFKEESLKSETIITKTQDTETLKADVSKTDVSKAESDTSVSNFSPTKFNVLASFLEPYPEDAAKSGYTNQTIEKYISQANDTLTEEKKVSSDNDKLNDSFGANTKKDTFIELKPIKKDASFRESKMSELDRLVARLIEDNLDKDKDKGK
ncbi:MAG: hypothetical protein GXX10_09505 [Clostridiaceae bacterium]|nr:hypothetical protein [Clostridiaceae bacterium]